MLSVLLQVLLPVIDKFYHVVAADLMFFISNGPFGVSSLQSGASPGYITHGSEAKTVQQKRPAAIKERSLSMTIVLGLDCWLTFQVFRI